MLEAFAGADAPPTLEWIAPMMSACAATAAIMAAGAPPHRRVLAWLAGSVAGASVASLLVMTAWARIPGAIFAGLQLWQVLGIAAAIAAARAVAGARPGVGRVLLLVPLIPLMTLVAQVLVAMVASGERPLLAFGVPAWTVPVISASAAATVILTGRGSFPDRVGAWLGGTIVAAAATVVLHGPLVALVEAAPAEPAAPWRDPVFHAVQLWQAFGPVLAMVLAHIAITFRARAEDRARARIGFSTRLDAPI